MAKKKYSTGNPKHILFIVGVVVLLVVLVLAMQQMYQNMAFYVPASTTSPSGY